MKKIITLITSCFICSISIASTPINGLYAGLFGGASYLPENIHQTQNGSLFSHTDYQWGYHVGGRFGYKTTPIRFEGEVSYLEANLKGFQYQYANVSNPHGEAYGLFGLGSVYYDFTDMSPVIEPYVGLGLGVARVTAHLFGDAGSTPLVYKPSNSAFAYHATAGITYNFSENYALDVSYRYLATDRASEFNKTFQVHQLSLGATYRFDGGSY